MTRINEPSPDPGDIAWVWNEYRKILGRGVVMNAFGISESTLYKYCQDGKAPDIDSKTSIMLDRMCSQKNGDTPYQRWHHGWVMADDWRDDFCETEHVLRFSHLATDVGMVFAEVRSPDSEGGTAITHGERKLLNVKIWRAVTHGLRGMRMEKAG